MQKLPIILGIVGIVVVVAASILGWVVVPKIVDKKIEEEVRLVEDSDTWEKWSDIPFDVYMSFYIHSVTNPDDVEAGATPIFKEFGPYAYRQQRKRINITQPDGDETVHYHDFKKYTFDQEKSGDNSEDDLVNIINVPFVSVISGVRQRLPAFVTIISNGILRTEQLIRRDVRVGDMLFEGMDVSLYKDNPILGPQLPKEFDGGKFHLYEEEETSLPFLIYTGVGKSEDFGKIITYNGSAELGYWVPNTPCDQVAGTDGTIFPPFFKKDRKIDVFVTDLCRSLRLEYEETVKVKGMKAFRYTVPKYVLEDPRINADNLCYCGTPNEIEKCPKAAAMSLEGCRDGAPIMMSTPYFLDGDEGYLEKSGLDKPIREKHYTYLDLEPNSGVLLNGNKRIQVNIDLKRNNPDGENDGVMQYQGLQDDFLFPVMWVEESGMIDDKSADELKSKLLKPLKLVDILRWVFVALGIALFIAACILFFVKRRRSAMTV